MTDIRLPVSDEFERRSIESNSRRRLQQARSRAANNESQQGSKRKDQGEEPVRPMEEWADMVSQRIEEAMRRGMFDNLPGRGKPLVQRRDPFVSEDQRMALNLLRNNDLVPAWIAERREVLGTIDELRTILHDAAVTMQQEMGRAQGSSRRIRLRQIWSRWLEEQRGQVHDLNARIMALNLKQPTDSLEIYQLRFREELNQAGARMEWELALFQKSR